MNSTTALSRKSSLLLLATIIVLLTSSGAALNTETYNPSDGEVLSSTPIYFAFAYNGSSNGVACEVRNTNDGTLIASNNTVYNNTLSTLSADLADGNYSYAVRCDGDGDTDFSEPGEASATKSFSVNTGSSLPSVTAHSPSGGEVIQSSAVNFTVTYKGNLSSTTCLVMDNSNNVIAFESNVMNDTKYNITNKSMQDGTYDYEVKCDNDGDTRNGFEAGPSSQRSFAVNGSGGDGGGGGGAFAIDDFVASTASFYKSAAGAVNISFIGNTLKIKQGITGYWYNLTNPASTSLIDRILDPSWNLSTSNPNAGEGRHNAYEVNTTTQKKTDLVNKNHDVVGRIYGNGLGSAPSVSLYYWMNKTKIDTTYELKGPNPWNGSDEYLYRLNVSRDKYWISVDAKGYGQAVNPTRAVKRKKPPANYDSPTLPAADQPRVNDFVLRPAAVLEGKVINASSMSPVSGVQLKLEAMASFKQPYQGKRQPYLTRPPTRMEMSNGTGHYNFTGLTKGRYKVTVVNKSLAVSKRHDFQGNVNLDKLEKKRPIKVTENVGKASGKLIATKHPDIKYALAFFTESNDTKGSQIIKAGVEPGSFTLDSLPNKSGEFFAVKFDYRGNTSDYVEPEIVSKDVKIKKNENTNVGLLEFPTYVRVSGTVTGPNGKALDEARVQFVNESRNTYEYGETGTNGVYNFTVPNATKYTLRVEPPFDKELQSTKTTVSVDGPTTKDVQLTTGATLIGKVVDTKGNAVEDAYVNVQNFEKGSYGYDRNGTNSTGHFVISGLDKVKHQIDIYPPGKYGENHTNVTVSFQRTTGKVFQVSADTVNYSGYVTNKTGQGLNATVTVRGEDTRLSTSTNASGRFVLTGLPKAQYLRVEVTPKELKYGSVESSTYLYRNESENFTLTRSIGIQGYVTAGPNGPAVQDAWVSANNFSRQSWDSDRTNSNGRYSLDLKEVNHTVYVWPGRDSSLRPKEVEVNVTQAKDDLFNISLSKGTFVYGNITSSTQGSNFSGFIGVWNSTESAYGYTEFQGGTYNLTGLKDVSYNVWISVENDSYQTKRTSINAPTTIGNTANFTVNRPQGRKMEIKVVDNSTGSAIPNATVVLENTEKMTDSSGKARFGRQPKGASVSVAVKADGYKGQRTSFTVKSTKSCFSGSCETIMWQNETVKLPVVQTQLEASVNVTKQSSGKPVSGASVVFASNETGSSQSSSGVTGSSGYTTLKGLVKGPYVVALALGEDKFGVNTTRIKKGTVGFRDITISGTTYRLGYEVTTQ